MENKPCMKITLTDTKPSIFESKAGGLGYIPHDKDFPTDSNGTQLRLLAQIDCADIQLDGFMNKGLLQFWILCDDIYGIDFDNPTNQDGFRVIYYPEIDKTVTEEEIRSKFTENENDGDKFLMPVSNEWGMTFEKSEDSYVDYESEDEIDDEEWSKNAGHKVGGYPFFTQFDPRDEEKKEKYDFLLFQLDTEFEDNVEKVCWGDMGIGNFFISSEKLRQRDFTDVLYSWDCG
ncbi:MAG: YwqG family protein [Ruminococcus flavefaciens]|nr:YwqG family protein [Ruminococcus flavefaciens]